MKKILLFTTPVLYLIILVSIAFNVHFLQNDEWVYFLTIKNFLKLNFGLHPYIGATFYLQGFVSTLYSAVFGINKLPVLTALVSFVNVLILLKILKSYAIGTKEQLILLLFMVVNPIFFYSTIGFMTEQYFLLPFLLSLYFIVRFNKIPTTKDFLLANLSILLSF